MFEYTCNELNDQDVFDAIFGREEYEVGQIWDYFDGENKWLSSHVVTEIENRTVETLCIAFRDSIPWFGGRTLHPNLIGSKRDILCPIGKSRLV